MSAAASGAAKAGSSDEGAATANKPPEKMTARQQLAYVLSLTAPKAVAADASDKADEAVKADEAIQDVIQDGSCAFCGEGPSPQVGGDLIGPFVYVHSRRRYHCWAHSQCALWAPRVIDRGADAINDAYLVSLEVGAKALEVAAHFLVR